MKKVYVITIECDNKEFGNFSCLYGAYKSFKKALKELKARYEYLKENGTKTEGTFNETHFVISSAIETVKYNIVDMELE